MYHLYWENNSHFGFSCWGFRSLISMESKALTWNWQLHWDFRNHGNSPPSHPPAPQRGPRAVLQSTSRPPSDTNNSKSSCVGECYLYSSPRAPTKIQLRRLACTNLSSKMCLWLPLPFCHFPFNMQQNVQNNFINKGTILERRRNAYTPTTTSFQDAHCVSKTAAKNRTHWYFTGGGGVLGLARLRYVQNLERDFNFQIKQIWLSLFWQLREEKIGWRLLGTGTSAYFSLHSSAEFL